MTLARAALRAPFTRRAGRQALFALASPVPAVLACLVVIGLIAAGAGLALTLAGTVPGLAALMIALRLARRAGEMYRALARRLLGERCPPPAVFRPGRGLLGRLDARLRDGTAWRAAGYVAAKLPVACVGLYALSWYLSGLANLCAPLWWPLLRHHPAGARLSPFNVFVPLPGASFSITTWPATLAACATGAATLLVAPWLLAAVTAGDTWLMRGLLGPGRLDQRVAELEESRARAVDDAAAALRRVERDLHDGAQVRLAALAMGLGMAKERLGAAGEVGAADAARARDLVAAAHTSAKEALAELRDLARGIHPPVLDAGLPDALATLAARSIVPVRLAADIGERPTPAIEAIAYFCAAELLANVAKHSGASEAAVQVSQRRGRLRLRVSDNGHGGADPAAGSGLPGLAARVRTVDGRLELASPDGGPTVVTIDLPLRA